MRRVIRGRTTNRARIDTLETVTGILHRVSRSTSNHPAANLLASATETIYWAIHTLEKEQKA